MNSKVLPIAIASKWKLERLRLVSPKLLWYSLIIPSSYTWSAQKVSWILNLRGLRIFDFRFLCAVMLVLISLTCTVKFDHFECSVNFWQLFCLDVFWLVFDFCHFSFGNKKKSQGARSGEGGNYGNIIVLFRDLNIFCTLAAHYKLFLKLKHFV